MSESSLLTLAAMDGKALMMIAAFVLCTTVALSATVRITDRRKKHAELQALEHFIEELSLGAESYLPHIIRERVQ